MKVEFALLAEYGSSGADGRLNIVGGGLHRLGTPSFPTVVPNLCLVAGLELNSQEALERPEVEMRVLDPDGKSALPNASTARLQAPPVATTTAMPGEVRLVWGIQGFIFTRPGTYMFELLYRGKSIIRLPLELVTSPNPVLGIASMIRPPLSTSRQRTPRRPPQRRS